MVRHFRMLLSTVVAALGIFMMSDAFAQPVVHVSGRLLNPSGAAQAIRVFSSDTLYQVSGDFIIGRNGVLVIAPGTHVQFLPNGRIIDSAGGKIIADGNLRVTQYDFTPPGLGQTYCDQPYINSHIVATNNDAGVVTATTPYYYSTFYAANALPTGVTCSTPFRRPYITPAPITFEGVAVNVNSVEWGNFLILPGADSAFFRNCQFINFRKDTTVEPRTNLYPADITAGPAMLRAKSNGTGAAITNFSSKLYLRSCTFRNNVARIHGGAVAFLEFIAPAGSIVRTDDGRLAMFSVDNNGAQCNNLTFVNNSVTNNFASRALPVNGWNVNECDGGAVYIAGQATRLAATMGRIAPLDRWVFSGNSVTNAQAAGNFTQGARGGAVFVDSLTALTIYNGTFLSNSANTTKNDNSTGQIQKMALGGAVYSDTVLRLLDNAFFSSNTAGVGGGVYLNGNDLPSNRILQIQGPGIVFSANSARYNGGAVYSRADSNTVLGTGIDETNNQKVTFDGNRAGWAGGAIYASKTMNLVQWARFTNDSVRVYDAQFHLNVVGGGAIYAASAASIKGTDFITNRADTANGGAIYLSNPPAVNRYFGEAPVNVIAGADTLMDQRELTRFILNTAVRDTNDNHLPTRLQATGLGGAIFITVPSNVISYARTDSTFFSRIRFERNVSYSGAAVYSDLYDMRIVMSRCLVANNQSTSPIERSRDTVNGMSSRIAGAILYGEFEGPLPSYSGSYRGNAVYDNDARFVFRLPDSPVLGIGAGGADTLRGNFWGDGTNSPNGGVKGSPNVRVSQYNPLIPVNTFFVGTLPNTCLLQLPVESEPTFNYNPIAIGSIPDSLLFEGRVYDLLDKGTDIKTADYNDRINVPIQDFSIGGPRFLKSNLGPGANQNVRRLTRDPYLTDVNQDYAKYQTDFVGNHPVGYPLFLQAFGDAGTNANRTNFDPYARNYIVFYVYNKSTNEVVRLNMKETDVASMEFRGRLDFVPDRVDRDTLGRRQIENRPIYDVLQLGPLSRQEMSTSLDAAINSAARYNDSVALSGRRTEGIPSQFGSGDFRYSNVVTPPFVRYYSGERYNALPVLTGDTILVFSRSVLFKDGYVPAYTRGVRFAIGDVQKPAMRGYNVWTSVDPVNPNTRFIREDFSYPVNPATSTYPNIPVFTVAGVDTNKFYDPRWLKDATKNTQLGYSWDVLADAGISKRYKTWLKDSIFYGAYNESITFRRGSTTSTVVLSGSNGYLRLYGQPHNADVVPGGVMVTVSVSNRVPSKATELLAEQNGDMNNSIFLYPGYLNCNHLQQDTVEVRSQDSTYRFRIFVQDSSPVFTNTPEAVANLTDALRYCWDANTDDELEDNAAALTGWDFRYGRTQYSFGDPLDPNVARVQPQWMLNGYMKNDTLGADLGGVAFQSRGLLKVETDSANAITLLTPRPQNNGELAIDTVASVVVHDGHSGISRKTYALHVNVQPYIVTDVLPAAKEDDDYNMTMLDTLHAIAADDANRGDALTYYLVYRDASLNSALLDPTVFAGVEVDTANNAYKFRRDNYYYGTTACKFSDVPQVSANLTCPSWLKINPVSGILYGTPGLNDAPHSRNAGTAPDTVTVLVRDPYGLVAVKQLILDVDSTNHRPKFTNEPAVLCNLVGDSVSQDLTIQDLDFGRRAPFTDTLTLTVVSPAGGVTISPNVIGGAGDASMKTGNTTVHMSFNNPIGGQVTVTIRATDRSGATTDRKIIVFVSRKPAWRMNLLVGNNNGAYQNLTFGTGYRATAMLDQDYCEFALPPIPPKDVFDARWSLSDTSGSYGTLRDFRDSTLTSVSTYQGLVQAGGNNTNYPIYMQWSKKAIPANANQLFIRDRVGGRVFNVNMRTATPFTASLVQLIYPNPNDSDVVRLQVSNTQITGFTIVQDPLNSITEISGMPGSFELAQNYPNPFNPTTTIRFSVPTEQQTRLEVIDVMGRVIATLVNDKVGAGTYNVTWDGMDQAGNVVGSGVYFYRLSAGNFVEMKQMTMMK